MGTALIDLLTMMHALEAEIETTSRISPALSEPFRERAEARLDQTREDLRAVKTLIRNHG